MSKWRTVRLGDVVKIQQTSCAFGGDRVWLLNLDMIEQHTGKIIDYYYTNTSSNSTIAFDEEHVLYSKLRPNLNKVVCPNSKGFATSELLPLLPNKEFIIKEYLTEYLRSSYFVNWAVSKTTGAKMPRLAPKELMNKSIPLPPLEIQHQIAENLDKVTHLIDLCNSILDRLDLLVKSRFVEMFGDINVNDKEWDIQPLGELCTIVRGGSPRPIEQFLGGDVPWIKIGDATDGENIYLHSTKEYIIQEGVKKSRLIKTGSLIFANCGVSLGFARIITFDGCIHDGWLAMEDIDDRLNKVFLLQSLNQMTEHFRTIAPSGTQPNLNTAIMKAYRQIIPPMKLQKSYIAFVEQIDKSKLAVKQVLGKAETLKKALMQEYFG